MSDDTLDGNPYKSSDEILRRIMGGDLDSQSLEPRSDIQSLSAQNTPYPQPASENIYPSSAPQTSFPSQDMWGTIDNAMSTQSSSQVTSNPNPTYTAKSVSADIDDTLHGMQPITSSTNQNTPTYSMAPATPTAVPETPVYPEQSVQWSSAQTQAQPAVQPMAQSAQQLSGQPIQPTEQLSAHQDSPKIASDVSGTPNAEPNVNYDRELEKLISQKELKRGYNLRLFKVFLRDVVVIVVCASILAFLLKGFIFSPFAVPSGSMENTLQVGDNIIANKAALWGGIHRGDIVVFKDDEHWLPDSVANKDREDSKSNPINSFLKFVGLMPEDDSSFLVKRVIGLPGDHIVAEGGDKPLLINGVELDSEPYIKQPSSFSQMQFDITVPDGKLWVMGDNRGNSADSRYHMNESSKGFVARDSVVGIVDWIISPLSRFGGIESDVSKLRDIPNQ